MVAKRKNAKLDSNVLVRLAKSLELDSISIVSSSLRLKKGFFPQYAGGVKIEHQKSEGLKAVMTSKMTSVDGGEEVGGVFFVYGFGVRGLDSADSDAEALYTLEVEFSAIFMVEDLASLDRNDLELFGKKNVPHLLWPYIREYISSVFERASLPPFVLPLRLPAG